MSPLRRRVLLGSAAVLTVAGVAVASVAVADAATAATAAFSRTSAWDSGYVGQYRIVAGSDKLSGWTLQFDLAAGSTVTSLWNGTVSAGGLHYTVVNESWNGSVGAGASVDVGFQVAGLGNPSNCLLNGKPCGSATTTPSNTRSPSPTGVPSPTVIPSPTVAPPASGGGYGFAPYLDTDQTQDVAAAASAGNTKYVTLAFMLANGGSCSPAWNGGARDATWTTAVSNGIAALRAKGGDVILSFGGAAGTELAQACTTVGSLTTAYGSIIDQYGLTHVDFDIEGAAVADTASVDRRSQALASLQKTHPNLTVSLTLPVLPTGLDAGGLAILRSAKANGLVVSVVNVMAMDYGQWAAPDGTAMAAYAEQAATATKDQVKSVWTALSDAQAWAAVGVTPMIGVNDQCWTGYCETFTVADASALLGFARTHHLGRLAMWSLNRDVQCAGGTHTYADPSCSSVLQADHAFSRTLAAYNS